MPPDLRFDIVTLHPAITEGPLSSSIMGRAIDAGIIEVNTTNIRDFGLGRHQQVDDSPYGGGAGMVMRVDVVADAVEAARGADGHVIHLTPIGRRFDQRMAERLATMSHIVLLCGHYEGIDARIEAIVDEEISLGDFVMTGGEIAACAVVDAVSRLVPGVLGNASSAEDESFTGDLLEYPQYTRPAVWREQAVPEVLLSGHHAKIDAWRHEQALARTKARRPDLLRERQHEPSEALDESAEER